MSSGTLARSYTWHAACAGHPRSSTNGLHLVVLTKPFRGPRMQVMPNERWALLGGNGAGKSTLLRAVAAAARGDEYADAEIAVDPRLRLGMLEQVGDGERANGGWAGVPRCNETASRGSLCGQSYGLVFKSVHGRGARWGGEGEIAPRLVRRAHTGLAARLPASTLLAFSAPGP